MKKQQLYIKNAKGRYEPYEPKELGTKNVYRKVGNKYVPFAVVCKDEDWMQGGVFVVRNDKEYGIRSFADSEYLQEVFRIDRISKNYRITTEQLASLEDYSDFAWRELHKFRIDRNKDGYGLSNAEEIACVIGSVFKFSEILKERIKQENAEVRQPEDMNPRF